VITSLATGVAVLTVLMSALADRVGGDPLGFAERRLPAWLTTFGAGAAVGAGPRVVGEVGLPALVGQLGLEADVGRLGSFLRFRGDQAGVAQAAVDASPGHGGAVVVVQVPADGVRPGVEVLLGQFLTQPPDQLDRGWGEADGAVCGRLDRGSNAASPSAWWRASSL